MADPGPGSVLGPNGDLNKNIANTTAELEKQEKLTKKIDENVTRTSKTFKDLYETSRKTTAEVGKLDDELDKASKVADRFSQGLKNAFSSIGRGLAGFAGDLDKLRVEANRFGSEWQNAFGQAGKSFDQVREKSQATAIQLRALAESGKITYDQLQAISKQTAALGTSFDSVLQIFQSGNGLQLVNQGFLDLEEVTNITSVAINQLGQTTEQVNKTLLSTVTSIDKLNLSFGKSVMSTHQLVQQVQALQSGFKFLGVDAERLPGILTAFAATSEAARKAGTWAPTGAVGAEVGGRLLGDMASMGPDKTTFFGQMGGLGGGLSAGVEFEELMRGNVGEAAGSIIKTIQSLSGQGFVSGRDVMSAKNSGNTAEAERLAAIREQQIAMTQELTGRSREDARSLVESGAGGIDSLAKALAVGGEPKQDEMITLQRRLAEDTTSVARGTQTVVERFDKFIAYYKQVGASFEATVQVAAGIGLIMQKAMDYWKFLPNIYDAIKGMGGWLSSLLGIGGGAAAGAGAAGAGKGMLARAAGGARMVGAGLLTPTAGVVGAGAVAIGATYYAKSQGQEVRAEQASRALQYAHGSSLDASARADLLLAEGKITPEQAMMMKATNSVSALAGQYNAVQSGAKKMYDEGWSPYREISAEHGIATSVTPTLDSTQQLLMQYSTGQEQLTPEKKKYLLQKLKMARDSVNTSIPSLKNAATEGGRLDKYGDAFGQMEGNKSVLDQAIQMLEGDISGKTSAVMNTANTLEAHRQTQQSEFQRPPELTEFMDKLQNMKIGGVLDLEVALSKTVRQAIQATIQEGTVLAGPMAVR